MRMNQKNRLFCILIVVYLFSPQRMFYAQEAEEPGLARSFAQVDLDGDGQPDYAEIQAHYLSDADRMLVYDTAGDMTWSEDWRAGTDFANDIWIFHTGGSRFPQLIIRFETAEDQYIANLYDDINGDGRVAYRVQGRRVEITESQQPTVRMMAAGPWLRADGSINNLLHVQTFRAHAQARRVDAPFREDGSPIFERLMIDDDGDGVVDHEVTQFYPAIPAEWLFERTTIQSFIDPPAALRFEDYFFWPYLGRVLVYPWEFGQVLRAPGDLFPPVIVDWDAAQIRAVASLLPEWGGNRLKYNSHTPLSWQGDNVLAFERFAHYRFTPSDLPNMLVRASFAQEGLGGYVVRDGHRLYTQQVEINWQNPNHVGTLIMDYKLELAGLHPMPDTANTFGDFRVYDIPYADWLSYYISYPWAYATFVAAEGRGYQTNETIYEWNTIEGVVIDIAANEHVENANQEQHAYLFGTNTTTPAGQYNRIREGFRGEYADLLDQPAELYLSAVDHKLHLAGASHGVWNLGGGREVRYANLDGDAYLDHWQALDGARVEQELFSAGDFLIYAGAGRVEIRAFEGAPAAFHTLPPRSAAEWEALYARMAAQGTEEGAPPDFAELISAHEDVYHISGAALRSPRFTPRGFRFVIEAGEGFQANLPGLEGPGAYLAESDGGQWSARHLTPPQIAVPGGITFDTQTYTELQPLRASATLYNSGLDDARGLTVRWLAQHEQDSALIQTTVVDVPGEGETRLDVIWSPPQPGEWTLRLEYGDEGAGAAYNLSVDAYAANIPGQYLSLNGEQPFNGLLIVVLLGALAAAAAMLFLLAILWQSGES